MIKRPRTLVLAGMSFVLAIVFPYVALIIADRRRSILAVLATLLVIYFVILRVLARSVWRAGSPNHKPGSTALLAAIGATSITAGYTIVGWVLSATQGPEDDYLTAEVVLTILIAGPTIAFVASYLVLSKARDNAGRVPD